MLDHKLQI